VPASRLRDRLRQDGAVLELTAAAVA